MTIDAYIKRGALWERIRAYLLRYHGPKEVDIETLRAVLGPPLREDEHQES